MYNIQRQQLHDKIAFYSRFVSGRILDVGAGEHLRYKHLFKHSEYVPFDRKDGDARSLPFADESFDAIVCTQMLGDVFEVQQVFDEFSRVLKPGGVVLATENLFGPLDYEDYWRFTPMSLTKLAQGAKFKVMTVAKIGGYYTAICHLANKRLLRWLNQSSRLQMAAYNRYAKLKGMKAQVLDWLFPDEKHMSGFVLLARKPLWGSDLSLVPYRALHHD